MLNRYSVLISAMGIVGLKHMIHYRFCKHLCVVGLVLHDIPGIEGVDTV